MYTYIGVLLEGLNEFFTKLAVRTTKKVGTAGLENIINSILETKRSLK